MNKNVEYVIRYVDNLSESEAKETLKKILSERYNTESTNELNKIDKQLSAMYIAENRKEINTEIPKLKI